MARKVGPIIARGDRRWLIRVYLGYDHETKKRNYHNRTIHGSMKEAQAYRTRKLREIEFRCLVSVPAPIARPKADFERSGDI